VLKWGSGYDKAISRDNSFIENRDITRKRVESQIRHSASNGEEVVVSPPPGSGKTYSSMKLAKEPGKQVTLAMQTYDLIDEKVKEAHDEFGVEAIAIKSAYETCPTYTGECGDEWARRVKSTSLTPSTLHMMSESNDSGFEMPCDTETCPYSLQFNREFSDVDLIVTTQGMLHSESLVEDRIVIIDEFDYGTYIEQIDDPRAVVNNYLDFIDSPLESWSRIKEYFRNASESEVWKALNQHSTLASDNEEAWVDKCLKEIGNESYHTHREANKLVIGLLEGDKTDDLILHERASYETVKINKNGAWMLNGPKFTDSDAIIGLDATGTEEMWSRFYRKGISQLDIITEEERKLLWRQSGGEIVQVGDSAYHASGGNLPADKMKPLQDLLEKTSGKTTTFSTKKVKDHSDLEVDAYYGRDDKGTNDFKDTDSMLVAGAPHPGDDVILEIAEWFGVKGDTPCRDDPSRMGKHLDYGTDEAQMVLNQFRESRVLQAIYRGNRMTGDGLKVMLATSCIPDWLPIESQIPIPREPGRKERAVLKALRVLDKPTTERVCRFIGRRGEGPQSVSPQYVRRVATKYSVIGFIKVSKDPQDKRRYIYEFTGPKLKEIENNVAKLVSSRFNNDPVSEHQSKIEQIVDELMELSWGELDWAEYLTSMPVSYATSSARAT
jgi:DNA-binding MarR family transcriptional regulator